MSCRRKFNVIANADKKGEGKETLPSHPGTPSLYKSILFFLIHRRVIKRFQFICRQCPVVNGETTQFSIKTFLIFRYAIRIGRPFGMIPLCDGKVCPIGSSIKDGSLVVKRIKVFIYIQLTVYIYLN